MEDILDPPKVLFDVHFGYFNCIESDLNGRLPGNTDVSDFLS